MDEVLIRYLSMIKHISSGVVGSKENSLKEVEEGIEGGEDVDKKEEQGEDDISCVHGLLTRLE